METSVFIRKFTGRYLWLNLAAMAAMIVALVVALQVCMNLYTHHGESIALPDVRKHSYDNAVKMLEDLGMEVQVVDTGYVKSLPEGTVLTMLPEPGTKVKSGRIVYITVNAGDSPTIPLPDLIDNSSIREAEARLTAMGFKLGDPQYVPGEKDWVYGILLNGKNVVAGQRVPSDGILIIQVGNGQRDAQDSVYTTDLPHEETEEDPFNGVYDGGGVITGGGDVDNFEVVE